MYSHVEPIPEISTSVLEPVAEQVVRYIISRIGFSDIIGNNIMFEGTNETTSKTTDDQENRVLTSNKLICNVSNIMSPKDTPYDMLNSAHITSEGYVLSKVLDNFPIFSDSINKLFIFSLDRPGAIQLECTFHFKDRTTAYELGNRMFTIFQNGATIPTIELMFDYPIPEQMLVSMFTIYKMTEFYKNPANNFIDYLREGSNYHITLKSNKFFPDTRQLVVQRTLKHSLIKIDFTDPNVNAEKKEKAPIKFTNQMTITVQFSKPADMIFQFPIMVNNELVPYQLIPSHAVPPQPPLLVYPEIHINNFFKQVNASSIWWCLQFWSKDVLLDIKNPNEWMSKLIEAWVHSRKDWIYRVPKYDNWHPPAQPRFPSNAYNPIVIFIVQIDPVDGVLRLHLYNDVKPATGVSTEVIDYVRDNPEDIFFPGLKFLLSVYRDDNLLDMSQVSIAGDWLIIQTNKMHAVHRVAIYSQVYIDNQVTRPSFGVGIFDIIVEKE